MKSSKEEIAKRAYQKYLERGGKHGLDQNDWYEAEREIMKEQNKPKKAVKPTKKNKKKKL
jgi:hypothetical protein